VKCGGSVKWWVTVGLQASPPWTAGSAIAVAVPHGRGNSDRGLRAFVAQAGPSKDHPIKPGGGVTECRARGLAGLIITFMFTQTVKTSRVGT